MKSKEVRWKGDSGKDGQLTLRERDTTAWSELPRGGRGEIEKSSGSEVRQRSRREGEPEEESGKRVGKETIWERDWETEKLKV